MYEYISGKLTDVTPATAVIDCHGVGYLLEITLNTYTAIKDLTEVKLMVHEVIRDDAHLLYGFFGADERDLYRLLISVSGVGPATARVLLSTFTVEELRTAIVSQDAKRVQSAKGVGPKAAQRIVLELHDKVGGSAADTLSSLTAASHTMDEAQAALLMLGFAKPAVAKALQHLSKSLDPAASVEEIIKKALAML